jgi:hypothetical protein
MIAISQTYLHRLKKYICTAVLSTQQHIPISQPTNKPCSLFVGAKIRPAGQKEKSYY